MSPLRQLREPRNLLALLPLAVAAVAWWREAMWFQSSGFDTGAQVAVFILLAASAIYPASLLVLHKVKSRIGVSVLALGLAAATLFIAREAVIALVQWGYSQELHAYTSVIAVAASKRGLLFVLCAAAVPLLVATSLLLGRLRAADESVVSPYEPCKSRIDG